MNNIIEKIDFNRPYEEQIKDYKKNLIDTIYKMYGREKIKHIDVKENEGKLNVNITFNQSYTIYSIDI